MGYSSKETGDSMKVTAKPFADIVEIEIGKRDDNGVEVKKSIRMDYQSSLKLLLTLQKLHY